MAFWGSQDIDSFIDISHTKPYNEILPTNNKVPPSYVACVIGASREIGAGIAHAFAQAGASTLILASRSTAGLQSTAEQCRSLAPNCQVETIVCDISSSSSVENLARTIKQRIGRLDAVVINSGWSGPVLLNVTEGDPEVFKQVNETNYFGTYYAAHYLVPLLRASPQAGDSPKAFFIVGSNASFIVRGPIANFQYCVSKSAQLKLIEHIHEQHGNVSKPGPEILVASIHPGAVNSQGAAETCPEEFLPYLVDDPELCGAFITWLLKPRKGDGVRWLGGRHLVAKWDVGELEKRKDEVIEKDLLKAQFSV